MDEETVSGWLADLAAPAGLRRVLRRAMSSGGGGRTGEAEECARAWLAVAAAREAPGLVVAVTESPRTMERLADDLAALGGEEGNG